jgi:photosystem II stability/assembly factor-like uncharacterized protein
MNKSLLTFLAILLSLSSLRAQQSNQHATSSLQQQQSSGWQQVNIGATNNLYSVDFINPDTGWIAGDEGIFHTTDHGVTWLLWGPSGSYRNVQFLNQQIGWIKERNTTTILKTTNAGQTWNTELAGNGEMLFVNADTGFVCGARDVARTTDGGMHWTSGIVDSSNGLYTIFAFDKAHLNILGNFLEFVNSPPNPPLNVVANFFTSDAGSVWKRRVFPSMQPQSAVGYGFDSLHGVISGINTSKDTCFIGVTSDGGASWKFIKQFAFGAGGAFMTSLSTLYLAGITVNLSSSILCSIDGGTQWTMQSCPNVGILNGIEFSTSLDGWVVGDGGAVLHTTNGGFTSGVVQAPTLLNLPVEVYPNPATNEVSFHYTLPKAESITLKAYSITGKLVFTLLNNALQNPGLQNISLPTGSLISGDYVFQLKSRDYIRSGRFSIVK